MQFVENCRFQWHFPNARVTLTTYSTTVVADGHIFAWREKKLFYSEKKKRKKKTMRARKRRRERDPTRRARESEWKSERETNRRNGDGDRTREGYERASGRDARTEKRGKTFGVLCICRTRFNVAATGPNGHSR